MLVFPADVTLTWSEFQRVGATIKNVLVPITSLPAAFR